MKSPGPVATLFAVVAFAALLLVVNTATPQPGSQPAPAAVAAPAAAPLTPPLPPPPPPPASTPPEPAPPAAEPAPAFAGVFAGRSSGTKNRREVTVAIAVAGGRAVAYVCDGRKVEAWLEGTAADGRLDLTGPHDAALTATFTPDSARGEITIGRKHWSFTTRAAGRPAGLYESRSDVNGVAGRIGWIVLPDGAQVGIRTTAGADPQPAPPLDPTSLTAVVDGTPVPVRVVDATDAGSGPTR